jgi:hypothetical protein
MVNLISFSALMLMRVDPGAVGEKMMAAPPSDCREASLASAEKRDGAGVQHGLEARATVETAAIREMIVVEELLGQAVGKGDIIQAGDGERFENRCSTRKPIFNAL